ncbi:hypothetical protein QTP88_002336 [Uroleucon formosanum]
MVEISEIDKFREMLIALLATMIAKQMSWIKSEDDEDEVSEGITQFLKAIEEESQNNSKVKGTKGDFGELKRKILRYEVQPMTDGRFVIKHLKAIESNTTLFRSKQLNHDLKTKQNSLDDLTIGKISPVEKYKTEHGYHQMLRQGTKVITCYRVNKECGSGAEYSMAEPTEQQIGTWITSCCFQ